MKIVLDDQVFDPDPEVNRRLREGEIGARNFEEFRSVVEKAVRERQKIDEIHFDNDLGEGEIEGIEILKWLKDTYPEIVIEARCEVHSSNLPRAEAMRELVKDMKERPKEYIEAKERTHPWGEMERKR